MTALVRRGRAAVLTAPNRLETWEVDVPDPLPGGALVRVQLAGVCGTDLHLLKGAYQLDVPITLGHEGVGVIEALGAGVSTDHAGVPVRPGDRVCWAPYALCHCCHSCTVLEETPCENARFYADARKPGWGSYADYAWLPPGLAFFRLPDGASAEAVAALGCGLPTALRAFDRHGAQLRGADVAVLGAGAVGLSSVLLARLGGARTIIAVDASPARLEAALRLGATEAIPLSVDVDERRRRIQAACGGRGPALVVEAAGVLQAFTEAMDLVAPHGTVAIVGLGANQDAIEMRPGQLSRFNLTLVGATYPKPRHYHQAMLLAARLEDELGLSRLITHRFPIDRARDALMVVKAGEAIKAVILP